MKLGGSLNTKRPLSRFIRHFSSNQTNLQTREWFCTRFTPLTPYYPLGKEAVLLLNYELPKGTASFFDAETKICADGGANLLYKMNSNLIPDHVVGDFDSIIPEVREFYEKKKVHFHPSRCQETTDLEKSLAVLSQLEEKIGYKYDTVILLGSLGGSIGHSFANLNTLFQFPDRNMVLVGPRSLAIAAWPGKTIIHKENEVLRSCSLIPLGQPAVVTTKGLRWDITKRVLAFGKSISTSNEMEQNQIEIETDQPILWVLDFSKDIEKN